MLGGEKCLCCSRATLAVPLCKNCIPLLTDSHTTETCSVCGRVLVSEIGRCSLCRDSPVLSSVDRAFSLHSYHLWKKSLLFAWKFEDKRNLSAYFAAVVLQKLRAIESEEGMRIPVVPVPPRPGKIKNRGWDQIDELCFYLEKGWNVRVLRLLERISRSQQKKLDRVQRLDAMGSSYRLRKRRVISRLLPQLPPAVLILDDVLTTGATVESCACQLKTLGIQKIFSLTLFIVD